MSNDIEDINNNKTDELESLNLDKEEMQSDEAITVQEHKLDRDQFIDYLSRVLSRQDVNKSLIGLDANFYENVDKAKLEFELGPKLSYHIQQFIAARLDKIITAAHTYSPAVYEKLATEERDLYCNMCQAVEKFQKEISEKIKKIE
jgi:DNA replication initiation complex subunit (GINS family)